MTDTIKVRAMRFALQTAKSEYDAGQDTADVITYLTAIVRAQAPVRPAYNPVSMSALAGRPNGKYRCQVCKCRFGENRVSRLQSRRAYLTLYCPHCGHCWYTDSN